MGILSPYFDASFDGASFWELGQWYPGIDVETEGTLHSLGSGVHTFVDMGRAALVFEVQAGVEGTQLAALDGKRGDSGSLVWSRGTMTATLLDILRNPGEADAFDANAVTLRFFSGDLPAGAVSSTAFITEAGDTFVTEAGDTFIQE